MVGGAPAEVAAWIEAGHRSGVRVMAAPGPKGLEAAALTGLAAAGIDGLQVRLYAADAAAHDYHAGVEGSLRATTAMLRAARAGRVKVWVTTPLTRSNARVLAGLPGLLVDVAVRGWRVVVAARGPEEGAGRGAVAPRLATALPHALRAMVAAERAGMHTTIEGAPSCLLGPLRDRGSRWPRQAFAGQCRGCPGRSECPGVEAGYLERFGGDELSPRALQVVDTFKNNNFKNGLWDMFSGVWLELGDAACWPI